MTPESLDRRQFMKIAAGAVALTSLTGTSVWGADKTVQASDGLVKELIQGNDQDIPRLLKQQNRQQGHRWLGGLMSDYGFPTPGGTSGFISALGCALCAPQSKYYQSTELVEPLRLAVNYMLEAQHDEDGTVDYYATNFHSPPDVAFIVEVLSPVCVLLRANTMAALQSVTENLGRFIQRAGDGLVTGGIHTPNHRWVACAALAWANTLFPHPKYVGRVDQWLAETIDIDPDGQYTEKSTTVYSPIVDRALITVAHLLKRPELYEPVRRNLEMTLFYIHPDGEVVTEASRRQDRYQRGSMARYYFSYRWMALHDRNGRFAAMTREIERTARTHLRSELSTFLGEPFFGRDLPADQALPTDYAKVFTYSSLARIRRGNASGTILAGNTTLFSYRRGGAALEAVRFASAFFGKGQFVGDALEAQGSRYVLRQELDGPYFQPLTAEQIAHGDHARMAPNGTLATDSRALRVRSNIQTLVSQVEITENKGVFKLSFSIKGTDDVPVAIELAFRHGGKLEGVEPAPGVKDGYLLRSGKGRYVAGDDVIEFSPGRADHTYTQVRGAVPKWDGQSVYLTGLTPFTFDLTIG